MGQLITTSGPPAQLVGPPSVVLVPAALVAIPVVRTALQNALNERCWEDDAAYRVLLATTEATANAIEHGSRDGELIEVTYQVGDGETHVRVLDGGGATPWTPPATPAQPSIDETRGRGLLLITNLAERVEVHTSGRGTELRLNFQRYAA